MAAPPVLSLRNVSIGFGGTPLFEGADLHLTPGDRGCLVGRNGSGKSTLMKMIAGDIEPDSGERYVEPGLTIEYLHQEPASPPGETVADHIRDGRHPDHVVEAILDRLALPGDRLAASLSGGERRRMALARVFADPPALLLLDEPTNHLDLATIEWLERELNAYRGAALIVSHDRTFLTNVTNRAFWLERGTLRRNDRGFADFDAWCEAVLEAEVAEAERLDTRLAQEKRWLLRGVTARRRRNQGRLRKLEAMRAARAALLDTRGSIRAKIEDGEIRSRLVIEAKGIAKSFEENGATRPIVAGFSTRILRGDRIGILGPNGAGKTTLLRMLIGELEPDNGTVRIGKQLRIAYFDQQRAALDPEETLKRTLCGGDSDTVVVGDSPRNVRAYLKDFLFDPRQAEAKVKTLSGGERNRLLLARLLCQPSDLMVLDEPTNDLDMETLDLLQDLLADYTGTILLVSHDRDFLDRTVSSTIAMEGGGRATEYPGGYSDDVAQRKAAPPSPLTAGTKPARREAGAKPAARPRSTVQAKLSYKDQRELELLPGRIAEYEAEIVRLERELADPDLFLRDPDRFRTAAAALDTARADLAAAEDRWLELETLREALEGASG